MTLPTRMAQNKCGAASKSAKNSNDARAPKRNTVTECGRLEHCAAPRLSCALCSEYGRYCLQQYIEIEPKALIADIEQVLRSLDPEVSIAA